MLSYSRRSVLMKSGILAAAPALWSLNPGQALAAQSTSSTKYSHNVFSPELAEYICRQAIPITQARRNNALTGKHFQIAAELLGMASDHLARSPLDKLVKTAARVQPSALQQSSRPALEQGIALYQQYDTAASASELVPMAPPWGKQAALLSQYIAGVGVSGVFRDTADVLSLTAHNHTSFGIKPALYNRHREHMPGLDLAIFDPSHRAHLLRVCEPKKPAICSQLAQWTNYTTGGILTLLGIACAPPVLAVINVELPGISIPLDAACAVIAVNPGFAIYTIGTLASLILSGIQLALC